MEYAIEIENLQKSFGDVKAVRGITFNVKKGKFFAFLGVNGAGKSTTISLLCGTQRRDAGTVKVNGTDVDEDPAKIKRAFGVVFQSSVLDGALTVKDNLLSRASLYGIVGKEAEERINELANRLSFAELLGRTLKTLSGGQRRKIDLARAILHKPEILILDEPTTGLDPKTREQVWQAVYSLQKDEGVTVFLTTHYMEEASVADYVVILNKGEIVAQGTPLELKNAYTGDFVYLYGVGEEKVRGLEIPYQKIADGYRLEVKNTAQATDLILKHPDLFKDYEITKGKMDDVFLAVTGQSAKGGDVV